MIVRPYRLYGETELRDVTHCISAVITGWADEWVAGTGFLPEITAGTTPVDASNDMVWWIAGAHEMPMLAIGHDRAWADRLPVMLFGEDAENAPSRGPFQLTDELARCVVHDLAVRLLQAAGVTDGDAHPCRQGSPPDDVGQPGSAYLSLHCHFHGVTSLHLLLWPEIVNRWIGGFAIPVGRPVLPVPGALGAERVALDVIVGKGELTLEELGAMAPGDVITLDRRLDQELALSVGGENAVCGGFLGSLHGRRAVQLVTKQ